MNLNNAIAARTQPASKYRWQGWLFALGFATAALSALGASGAVQAANEKLPEKTYNMAPNAPERQTAQQAFAKTEGCMTCHTQTDEHTMHANPGVVLGCTDCHGGDATVAGAGVRVRLETLKGRRVAGSSVIAFERHDGSSPLAELTGVSRRLARSLLRAAQ